MATKIVPAKAGERIVIVDYHGDYVYMFDALVVAWVIDTETQIPQPACIGNLQAESYSTGRPRWGSVTTAPDGRLFVTAENGWIGPLTDFWSYIATLVLITPTYVPLWMGGVLVYADIAENYMTYAQQYPSIAAPYIPPKQLDAQFDQAKFDAEWDAARAAEEAKSEAEP